MALVIVSLRSATFARTSTVNFPWQLATKTESLGVNNQTCLVDNYQNTSGCDTQSNLIPCQYEKDTYEHNLFFQLVALNLSGTEFVHSFAAGR